MMRLRSIILLDFDNVWYSLRKESERAALRFANSPRVWVDAIANGELLAFTESDAVERAILFMRCYANPNLMQHAKCRPSFTRAGFSVIDCPPLTNQGKNSADIHLVLDAIELLEHSTRFDEFIVLSADADFTPLLIKLRTHDRRTAVFANQETAAAYRAVASGMLKLNDMLDFLLESGGGCGANGSSVDTDLANRTIDEQMAMRLIEIVHSAIANAPIPIPGAKAAQLASDAVGGDHRCWAGYGQFSKLIKTRLDPRYLYESDSLWDPTRHTAPEAPGSIAGNSTLSPRIDDLPAELREFALRLRGLTECPMLTEPQFRTLFEVFAARVQGEPFDLNSMSRDVRDELRSRGLAIGRAAVGFVMKGVQRSGHDFGGASTPSALAAAYRDGLIALCEQAGAELSAEESRLLGEWLGC